MYISLSTYEVTTICQKAFNCNFLLIKTYLKKRNTWTRTFYKCWKWYCGYHKNVIGPNTFVTLYGFWTKIYQFKQNLVFFKVGQWLGQVSAIVTKIYLFFLKAKLNIVSLKVNIGNVTLSTFRRVTLLKDICSRLAGLVSCKHWLCTKHCHYFSSKHLKKHFTLRNNKLLIESQYL